MLKTVKAKTKKRRRNLFGNSSKFITIKIWSPGAVSSYTILI